MHDPLWVCRDGRVMKVSEMDDSHLARSIARIERSKRGWRREFLERLKLELEIRSIEHGR